MNRRTIESFSGCFLGGAIGDAMGASVEFMPLARIKDAFGDAGVQDISQVLDGTSLARFTDDTQMTLFTAEGLLRAFNRFKERGICHPPSVVHHAYIHWLHTQGEKAGLEFFEREEDDGWLVKVPELQFRRAPGNTCLSALMSGKMGDISNPVNNSKGCGGVMRAAPVGLFVKSDNVFSMACETAAITHGHPTGFLAAGHLASVISSIIEGRSLLEAIEIASGELVKKPGYEECMESVRRAVALTQDPGVPPGPEAIESLGEGWVAEEALAISLYASLVADDDFAMGIRLAVNHGGDSDSTGAITGNILGALLGISSIPEDWIQHVELHEGIEVIAHDLLVALEEGVVSWDKYPGW